MNVDLLLCFKFVQPQQIIKCNKAGLAVAIFQRVSNGAAARF
jgi:hypothetical protein